MTQHAELLLSGFHTTLAGDMASDKIRLLMKLRREGITDTRVLSAIEQTPREAFVEEAFRARAYEDHALPIACDQTISQPTTVALMTQALQVEEKHLVLEIGTGSGYQAAVLSQLCRRVHTVERHRPLYQTAVARFDAMKLRNITPHYGDGYKGWPHAAPYSRIMVTCAAEEEPQPLLEQLADGGIMIIPLGGHVADQELFKITRNGNQFITERLFTVRFVPLVEEKASSH
jgi:protein-L-isoaspartate(D-aspartate) O-methyltransferase